jgi:hypothetical protein
VGVPEVVGVTDKDAVPDAEGESVRVTDAVACGEPELVGSWLGQAPKG